VTPDLDTLLTALYVEIDDHVIPSGRPSRGQPKKNRRPAPRHDVGKTTKRERTLKARRERAG
jgi:hypothetical protein